ncbi:hypothetical protein DFH07DRAFT_775825 [Mycena maculata]|uniref:Uncharacterized protein n=1 Tax=Mycena maculata TaxID=230809 RepID=A0AAD7IRQ6_9AGAR|nr:hypothetical protein DFH07DRAFT_775825 [Mycena maculata]
MADGVGALRIRITAPKCPWVDRIPSIKYTGAGAPLKIRITFKLWQPTARAGDTLIASQPSRSQRLSEGSENCPSTSASSRNNTYAILYATNDSQGTQLCMICSRVSKSDMVLRAECGFSNNGSGDMSRTGIVEVNQEWLIYVLLHKTDFLASKSRLAGAGNPRVAVAAGNTLKHQEAVPFESGGPGFDPAFAVGLSRFQFTSYRESRLAQETFP